MHLPDPSRSPQRGVSEEVSTEAPKDCACFLAPVPRVEKIEEFARGKWLCLQYVHFVDKDGVPRVWERFARTTTATNCCVVENPAGERSSIGFQSKSNGKEEQKDQKVSFLNEAPDSVVAFCVCTKKGRQPQVVVLKEYRACLGAYCLEFPAGLVDSGEDISTAALRELREETGFYGKVIQIGPRVPQSTIGKEDVHVVVCQIDLDAPENQQPVQDLDDGEDIQTLLLPLNNLLQELNKLATAQRCLILDGVYMLALGMAVAFPNFLEGLSEGTNSE